jgi:hypothetical protein
MSQHSLSRGARSRRRLLQAALLLGAGTAGTRFGAVVVRAYDVRLDEALAALQKAAALVDASSAGAVSAHTQHKFDNARDKAQAAIDDAMEQILLAGAIADADGESR